MVEGILLVDGAGRVVIVNPALRDLFSVLGAAEGQHYLEVVRQPAIASMIAAALEGRPTAPVEVEIEREPRRQVVANVVPVRGEQGDGAVLVLHDITDLRRADQVRRDFVANVSHELRTPLTAIRGYVEALVDSNPTPDESRHFLDVIARHTQRMERLVQDLLRLARLDAGQETVARTPVDVAEVVAAAVQDLLPLVTARRISVQTTVATDARRVTADARKLQDVIKNLVENAANYSPEGGQIDVTTHRDDRSVELSVADRGPGVPDADLPRIFERFYRVDRSRSRDPGGTGLGLSIVKHLVELQAGTVRAGHRPGGGAVFTVRLPAAPDLT
jgi:two-component system phosphate regulon sensor histidine kinase PhoR